MNLFRFASIALAAALVSSVAQAHGPKVSIGLNFGIPVYPRPHYHYHGPHVHYYPGYYVPRPVVIHQPVVVAPAPYVIEQQPTYVIPPAPAAPPPPPAPKFTQPALTTSTFQTADWQKSAQVDQLLPQLNDPDDKVRAEVVIQLGRLKADRAVDPLCATIAGDKSPLVRDSAARALGLIAAPRALTALLHAAKADPDHDVRRSAQFAIEIIKLNHGLK